MSLTVEQPADCRRRSGGGSLGDVRNFPGPAHGPNGNVPSRTARHASSGSPGSQPTSRTPERAGKFGRLTLASALLSGNEHPAGSRLPSDQRPATEHDRVTPKSRGVPEKRWPASTCRGAGSVLHGKQQPWPLLGWRQRPVSCHVSAGCLGNRHGRCLAAGLRSGCQMCDEEAGFDPMWRLLGWSTE
jgi:hypothetical protein